MKSNTVDFERLVDWVEGRLPASEAAAVAAAVAASDEATHKEVAWLRAFFYAQKEVTLAAPPLALHRTLLGLLAKPQPQPAPQPRLGLIQRLLATLTFDSGLTPALAGARSAQGAAARQVIYATPVAEVVVNMHPDLAARRVDLWGQILPLESLPLADFMVELLANEQVINHSAADDLGEFAFRAVEPGAYQIALVSDAHEITLTPLQIVL